MTEHEILSEPTGKQLDAWVAEAVFGWVCIEGGPGGGGEIFWRTPDGKTLEECDDLPAYSTDIADAWEVVERLRGERIYLMRLTNGTDVYGCWFGSGIHDLVYSELCDTAPLAICRAALLAKLRESERGKS